MTIYDLKPAFQKLLRPLCTLAVRLGLTANHLTLLALGMSCLWGLIFFNDAPRRWVFFGTPLILFIRMALNAMDGILAREYNMKSRLGALLNEMGDVISDLALYLPFSILHGIGTYTIWIVGVLIVIAEMAGVLAIQIGASRRYDGPMGKSDRAFVFGLISFLLGCGLPTGTWLTVAFSAVAAALVLTIVNRLRKALAESGDGEPG